MKTFALVDFWTERPVNKYAYSTCETMKEAFKNFRNKRWKESRMFPDMDENYEISKWKIVEVVRPLKKKKIEQLELGIVIKE